MSNWLSPPLVESITKFCRPSLCQVDHVGTEEGLVCLERFQRIFTDHDARKALFWFPAKGNVLNFNNNQNTETLIFWAVAHS